MIHEIRIHPAIGIMRVGNSADDFFIGPERPFDPVVPVQGFKNQACEVLRQGARFRLYAYDAAGALIGEVTASSGASISWTVELANTKATSPTTSPNSLNNTARNAGIGGAARQALNIRPGPRTLSLPNSRAVFDTGTFTYPVSGTPTAVSVPLGEMRMDAEGRLIVLGGFGKSGSPDPAAPISWFFDSPGWYDDVSDGPVNASVTVNGNTFQALGAWVICGPPDFAPAVDTVATLYDDLIAKHWPPAAGQVGNGGAPSYTQDVYPILRRAAGHKWVRDSQQPTSLSLPTAHLANAALRTAIASEVRGLPGGVTPVQDDVLAQWEAGNFTNDWAGEPAPGPITPDSLDRAALSACIGRRYYPGIEVGVWVDDPTRFSSRLRVDQATVQPGDASQRMALPWQADFHACGGDSWWPAQRPNTVLISGQSGRQAWVPAGTMAGMVTEWSKAGFVVPEAAQQVEVERCASPSVFLRTPVVTFHGEQGPGGMQRWLALPIVFEVTAPSAPLSLQITSSLALPFDVITMGQLTAPAGSSAVELKFLIRYQTQAAPTGATPDQASVTVQEVGGSRSWTVSLVGHTTSRQVTLVGLVLDRSGSMAGDRGDGQAKIDSLREAADIFVDAMLQDDAVAVVRYNHDAQAIVDPPVVVDDQTGPGTVRDGIKSQIDGPQFNPSGATSIGDGIEVARQILDATAGYGEKALLVLTDGNENSPKKIVDVASSIDDRVFAVGLGRPENTSAVALQTLTGNHGGYLLVTGDVTPEKEQILNKYFIQILAGLSNAEVVLDPSGELFAGEVHEIPFSLSEAAYGVDVYLLAEAAESLQLAVRTPAGEYVTPAVAQANHPLMLWIPRERMQLYRLAIPAEVTAERPVREGTWHAVVYRPKRRPRYKTPVKTDTLHMAVYARAAGAADVGSRARPITYTVMVNAYSDLRLVVWAHQKSREPGSSATLSVELAQWGVPLDDVHLWAEVTPPEGHAVRSTDRVELHGGRGQLRMDLNEPGVHKVRVRAVGRSLYGARFERESTRTFTVWEGGDQPPRENLDADGRWVEDQLDVARRLLDDLLRAGGTWTKGLEEKLRAHGLDPEDWREAVTRLERIGGGRQGSGSEEDTQPERGYVLKKYLDGLVGRVLGTEK